MQLNHERAQTCFEEISEPEQTSLISTADIADYLADIDCQNLTYYIFDLLNSYLMIKLGTSKYHSIRGFDRESARSMSSSLSTENSYVRNIVSAFRSHCLIEHVKHGRFIESILGEHLMRFAMSTIADAGATGSTIPDAWRDVLDREIIRDIVGEGERNRTKLFTPDEHAISLAMEAMGFTREEAIKDLLAASENVDDNETKSLHEFLAANPDPIKLVNQIVGADRLKLLGQVTGGMPSA